MAERVDRSTRQQPDDDIEDGAIAPSADWEAAGMNDELDRTNDNEVQRDGLAMLGILVLAIALIVYVGYNVI